MLRISVFTIIIIFSQAVQSQPIYMTREGLARFASNAPLEIIKAESSEVNGAINLSSRSFAFSISNKSFKGFNSSLQQEHFYENYMEIQDFPFSTFKGKIIEEIDTGTTREQLVRAKGVLDIHGVSQERIIKGTIRAQENTLILKAAFTVLLEDHQIKIPRVVNQKIAENIEVEIEAELKKEVSQ